METPLSKPRLRLRGFGDKEGHMDIVFIRPNAKQKLYQALDDYNLTAIEPPLWSALLAAYTRSHGLDVGIVDFEANANTSQVFDAKYCVIVVSGSNPSASTMQMSGVAELIRGIRHYGSPKIVLYGLHPSALPQETLHETDADFVIVGEGFRELVDLVQKGCSYKGIFYTQKLINLNALPMPAWDLIDLSNYRAHNWHCFNDIENRAPYGVIYTSLGCPFDCAFCVIHTMFCNKRVVRYRSPDEVVAEIRYLVSCGVRNIRIIDEMFTLNKQHVADICNKLLASGVNPDGLNMWAYARVGTVDQELLNLMRKAGIRWVCYGFESGSQRVLDDCAKGTKIDDVLSTVRMTRQASIHINANWLFGLPEDDLVSMNETLTLAKTINAEWANFYCAMAYPGSKLYKQALKEGWQLPASWEGYSQYSYSCLPLSTFHVSAGTVLAFRDQAFQSYFNRPEYLEMITQKFGKETALHIKKMCAVRLKRKYASG